MPTESLVAADKVPMKAVEWLWEPYIPRGMLTLVAGVPGQGKSLFTCWLAAQISKRSRVIMSSSEDDYSVIVRPRLEAAGANMKRISFMSPPPLLPRDTDKLLALIDKTRAALVILDPLQDHLEMSIFSPKTTHVLAPLSKDIGSRNVAVLAVSHTIKSMPKGAHPLYAVGGAAGGVARVMRVVHLFGPHPDDTSLRVLAVAKANFLPDDRKVSMSFSTAQSEIRRGRLLLQAGVLKSTGVVASVTASMIVQPSGGDGGSESHGDKRLKASRWLIARLDLEPERRLPVKQLQFDAEQADFSWMTIRRADEDIVHTKKVRVGVKGKRGGGIAYWQLPDKDRTSVA